MDQRQEQEKEEGTMDQRREEEVCQRKEEEEGKPEEPTGQRKEEEEGNPREPTDQRKEGVEREEGDNLKEPTDQREEGEKEDKSEELTDQRKLEVEEGEKEKEKGTETERSSGEESMEASSLSLFVHPCSLLLRYLFRAYAWCLGMADSFGEGGTRPSAAPAVCLNSSREEQGEVADIGTREISKTTTERGFYMRLWAVRRPRPPGNPREGRGGGGGHHN